jgi:hypothetical protein
MNYRIDLSRNQAITHIQREEYEELWVLRVN